MVAAVVLGFMFKTGRVKTCNGYNRWKTIDLAASAGTGSATAATSYPEAGASFAAGGAGVASAAGAGAAMTSSVRRLLRRILLLLLLLLPTLRHLLLMDALGMN